MDKQKPRVAIIDYKLSNLFSVERACEHVGLQARITCLAEEITRADAVILPGVGAFGTAMGNLRNLKLIEVIKNFIKSGKPFLGICLGQQLIFSESAEFGQHPGLNIIPGKVIKFPSHNFKNEVVKIPQIGWNSISPPSDQPNQWMDSPLSNIRSGENMYFVHSYYTIPDDKKNILTTTLYEDTLYASGIIHKNVVAFQFHPEKSGSEGIKIYKNWAMSIRK